MAVMNSYLRYFVIYNSLDSNVNLVYQRWGMELIGRFYNRGIYVEGNREKAEAVALWAVTEYSGNNMRINWLSALLEQILPLEIWGLHVSLCLGFTLPVVTVWLAGWITRRSKK